MLKLSKMTDYAVIILAEMVGVEGARVNASDLAGMTRLPEPTVSKVLKTLARHDLISSIRGANGGYILSKNADDIDMASVITALDGPIELTACAGDNVDACERADHCNIRGKWNPVNTAMQNALKNVSLAEMIGAYS